MEEAALPGPIATPPPAAARLARRQSGRRRAVPPPARGASPERGRGARGARGPPRQGPAQGGCRPRSAPGPERGKPPAEGVGREGAAGVIFHLSHLFRPARKSESRHIRKSERFLPGARRSGWLCARSRFSNSQLGFTPGPGADPDPLP